MIAPHLYDTLDKEEILLWHSHDNEARHTEPKLSTIFLCSPASLYCLKVTAPAATDLRIGAQRNAHSPNPNVPSADCEIAETQEMKEEIGLYGKTYHFWQVDKGDKLPLGSSEWMISFTKDDRQVCLSR